VTPKYSIAGFTLIELLVVIFIISIVTSVALLSIGRNENRQLESFANELAQRVTLAEEQAMLQPAVLGLRVDEFSYQFVTYNPSSGEKKPTWIPVQDKILGGQYLIPRDIELGVEVGGKHLATSDEEDTIKHPQVVISTNGDLTPFTIYVGKKGKSPRYIIRGEADGNVVTTLLP
jgi:general secretion pathway protein H